MNIRLRLTKDTISRDVVRALRAADHPRPALQAAGLVVVSRSQRAFDEPILRPASWAPLKPATIAAKVRRKLILRPRTIPTRVGRT